MPFSIEDWNNSTREIIGSASDLGQMTALMTQATEKVSELFVSFQEADKERVQLKEENEKLKAYNMDLFMKVSEQTRDRVDPIEQTTSKSKAEAITVSDLFKKGD